MTCSPAKVVDTFGACVAETFAIPYVFNQPGAGGVFLGSVGDQSHHGHASSHNCAPNPQESPVNGVGYDPNHAHAYDARPVNRTVGMQLVRATLADDRVRYVNYDNVRYYPDGSTDDPIDHPTFHVSFLPGTTNDTRPFFTDEGDLTVADIAELKDHIDKRTDGEEQRKRDRNRAKATAALSRSTNRMVEELLTAEAEGRKVDLATLKAARAARDAALLILDELDKQEDDA